MSQSTDLDRQDFNYSYVQLPSTPISEVKKTEIIHLQQICKNLMYEKSKFFFSKPNNH